MRFKNLEERMLYFRSLSDYKLIPNSYVIVMLDGRSFSSSIKKYFQKPFDDTFINIMNETAVYLCNKVQGCKFAYVQSDEISLVLTDFDIPAEGETYKDSDSFFKYRICKVLSICASLATSKFNQLMTIEAIKRAKNKKPDYSLDDIDDTIMHMKTYEFDCKAWNMATYNDVYAWNLYRQLDCIKNSKQQAAQTYIQHSELSGKTADTQIALLKEKKNIDWHTEYDDGKKYGRFIYKDTIQYHSEEYGDYTRDKFVVHNGWVLNDENGKKNFEILSKIPTNN